MADTRRATRELREQTKFDKWLLAQKAGRNVVKLVLEYSPIEQIPEGAVFSTPVLIIEVDRYMICVEFQEVLSEEEGGTWWIPKDSIKAAAKADDDDSTGLLDKLKPRV